MAAWFFDGWRSLLQTLLVGPLAYISIVILLRGSGKRTLGKMNAFDFVVTVALGSILASTVLSSSVSLADGITGLFTLVLAQYILTFLSVRSKSFERLVKSEPTLLYHKGEFLDKALRKERVTRTEIISAARQAGHADLKKVSAVVLETNCNFSVMTDVSAADSSVLDSVKTYEEGVAGSSPANLAH